MAAGRETTLIFSSYGVDSSGTKDSLMSKLSIFLSLVLLILVDLVRAEGTSQEGEKKVYIGIFSAPVDGNSLNSFLKTSGVTPSGFKIVLPKGMENLPLPECPFSPGIDANDFLQQCARSMTGFILQGAFTRSFPPGVFGSMERNGVPLIPMIQQALQPLNDLPPRATMFSVSLDEKGAQLLRENSALQAVVELTPQGKAESPEEILFGQ
jgi:hypothetical protein